jgi:SAM-dependent methyltransferase
MPITYFRTMPITYFRTMPITAEPGTNLAQNIYDTPDFFDGYSRLHRSVHGLDGAPEWSSILAVLPDIQGADIVDLGCGFGWFARWAASQGAASVLGLDLSRNMLDRARRDTKSPVVHYAIADLEHLDLPAESFNLAYSSLAFHYVEDFRRLARTVFRSIVQGGHFVFTIEHPIYMAPARPGWQVGPDGKKTWPIDRYAIEGIRTTDWLAKGVVKHHRTIGTTLNTLIGAGFTIRHVEEWRPTDEQVAALPTLHEELERPMIMLVSCVKQVQPG